MCVIDDDNMKEYELAIIVLIYRTCLAMRLWLRRV